MGRQARGKPAGAECLVLYLERHVLLRSAYIMYMQLHGALCGAVEEKERRSQSIPRLPYNAILYIHTYLHANVSLTVACRARGCDVRRQIGSE